MKIENAFAAPGGKSDDRSDDKRIEELQKRREGITAFKDITTQDRRILAQIDEELESITSHDEKMCAEKKKELFALIDIMEGAYSQTHERTIPPHEIKEIIEKVLAGDLPLNAVPRSAIFKREKNLRQIVKDLM